MDALDLARVLVSGRLLPLVVVEDATQAVPLGRALEAGGLTTVEVTLRTDTAVESLRRMATETDLVVGAGTVISPAQVDAVVEAGARYVVTPGFSASVVERCQTLGVPVIPGVATATEIQMAIEAGLDLLKFFPAEASGGVAALKALSGPFDRVRFVPTGGVTAENMTDYLRLKAVPAVGGSWMAPPDAVSSSDLERVTGLSRAAVARASST